MNQRRMPMPGLVAALLGVLALVSAATGALAEGKRFALVVGVDKYPALKSDFQLQRAVSDARAVSQKLSSMGFEVATAENATLRGLDRALTSTAVKAGPGDTVLLFFAGHGLSIRGQNFLLPGDLETPSLVGELAASETLRREAFLVDDVIERLRANGASNVILVLDACRNNPFRTTEGRSLGGARGLARQESPQGVFLLFSAGFGEEALDRLPGNDPDPNSVFTRTLVPLLDRPGLSLTDLAKEVQVEVRNLAASAGHPQTPAYYDQIVGRLSLTPASLSTAEPPPASSAPSAAPDPLARELTAWSALPDPADAASLRGFLAAFPKGSFAELARLRLAAIDKSQGAEKPAAATDNVRTQIVALTPPPDTTASPTSGGTLRKPDTDDARTQIVSLTPPPEILPPVLDGTELTRRTQSALNRLGCEAGDIDGNWGPSGRAALQRFTRATKRAGAEAPSADLLAALEAQPGTVCTPIAKTCPSGSKLDGNNRCVPNAVAIRPAPVVRPAAPVVRSAPPKAERPRPAPVRQATPPRRSGGNCFTFNGRQVCE